MGNSRKKSEKKTQTNMRPALSIDARQNQMICMANDLAEQQLRDGTASSQIITHFLKLGTIQAQVELEKLQLEKELIQAKKDDLQSHQRSEELMREAISAFKGYSGHSGDDDEP